MKHGFRITFLLPRSLWEVSALHTPQPQWVRPPLRRGQGEGWTRRRPHLPVGSSIRLNINYRAAQRQAPGPGVMLLEAGCRSLAPMELFHRGSTNHTRKECQRSAQNTNMPGRAGMESGGWERLNDTIENLYIYTYIYIYTHLRMKKLLQSK